MTKLYKDGITRNTDSPQVIAELKKCGYVEVVEEKQDAPEPIAQVEAEVKPKGKAGK